MFFRCIRCSHDVRTFNFPLKLFLQVVDYLLGETDFTASSSDSDDSDSDRPSVIQRMRKLWVFPKLANSEEKPSET